MYHGLKKKERLCKVNQLKIYQVEWKKPWYFQKEINRSKLLSTWYIESRCNTIKALSLIKS